MPSSLDCKGEQHRRMVEVGWSWGCVAMELIATTQREFRNKYSLQWSVVLEHLPPGDCYKEEELFNLSFLLPPCLGLSVLWFPDT